MTLRQRFEAIELSLLREWITNGQQEDLHLEFKSQFDKKTLAKAVSGFANSEGGIVVWGIDGRKDESGVDAATGLSPLPNVRAIFSQLQSLTGDSVSPLVDGVEHRLIAVEGDGAGYIATLVPTSDGGPHMAKLGENRYYKRSGDSFYVMEHFDVADMFGCRAHPSLVVAVDPKIDSRAHGTGGRRVWLRAMIIIENQGRGIARFPYLRVKVSPPYKFPDQSLTGLPERRGMSHEKGWRVFVGGVDDVIHASSKLNVNHVRLEVSEHASKVEDLLLEYEVGCEGVQPRRSEVRIDGGVLKDIAMEAMSE